MRSQKSIDMERDLHRDREAGERAFDHQREEIIGDHTERAFSHAYRTSLGGLGRRGRSGISVAGPSRKGAELRKPVKPGRTVYVFRNGKLVPKE